MNLYCSTGVTMISNQKCFWGLLILLNGIITIPNRVEAQLRQDSLNINELQVSHEPHELLLDPHLNSEIDTLYAKIVPSVDMETIEDRASCLELDVPLVINKSVCGFIHFFTVRKRNYTQTMLERKNYYFPIFEYYLKKHQMPDALKYLSIVESGLNFKARSKAGAVGLWQFMPGTGSDFYLANTQFIDERQNPYLATEAACKFLKYLYGMFNDWELALAAYNCGPGNVMKAMRKSGGRGFWEIYNFLPQETRSYVPQFHAVVYTMNFALEHNIKADLDSVLATTALDTFQIQKNVDIVKLGEILGLPKQALHHHNPSLKSKIYPSSSRFPLLVPSSHSPFLSANLDRFIDSAAVTKFEISTPSERGLGVYKYYNAKKGEKLGEIADRYNVDLATIQKWNNIKSDKLRKATKLKIYSSTQVQKAEVSSTKDTKASVLATTGNTLSEQDRNAEQHIVSKGEKLYQVAIRYGLTTSSIKKLNNLASSKISEGQVLILKKDKEAIESNLETGKKSNAEPTPILIVNQPVKEYTVKKGDRLFSIAKSYGLSISQLKELNHLNSDILKFGQVLRVSCSNETDCVSENQLDSTLKVNSLAETQKAEKKIQKHVFKEAKSKHVEISKMYLVQKGDTLYSITKKFTKLTIKDLMRINNLKNKNIKPGQQLIVG